MQKKSEKTKTETKVERAKRKKRSARDIFEANEAIAAEIIVEMMTNEGSSNSLKVDCAKEILNRLHGKTFEEISVLDLSAMIPDDVRDFCD